MDPSTAQFKRFWQPSYLEAIGLSLLAGTVATAVTHPIQYVKTIIQYRSQGIGMRGYKAAYQGYNPNKVFRQMHSMGGGLLGFYQGFEANLLSRLGYLAIRNTLYKVIYDNTKPAKPTNDLTSRQKAVIGGIAGGVAAFLTTPLTVISIRQIIDTQLKTQWRRNYTNIGQGLSALKSQKSSYRASTANVVRHVVLNASLTGPYDYFHQGLYIRFGDYDFVKPTAMFLAAFVSSCITLPFDNARTRLMNVQPLTQRNRINYFGYLDVFRQVMIRQPNLRSMYSGFYSYLLATYLYAWVTIGITQSFTDSWKRKAGLLQWQI